MREELENSMLSNFATLSAKSKGRQRLEEKCEIRTEFQRDRDRILYSKAFRRLKHKTQVFISPEGDHYRTRLTHTLEVSQIARTIARALKLNEDLTEAATLGHDLGHPPFGHAGEVVLNKILKELTGGHFMHNEQSLRVVDVLEGRNGLNLTFEVRDAILKHAKGRASIMSSYKLPCSELQGSPSGKFVLRHETPQQNCGVLQSQNKTPESRDDIPATPEAEVVRISDRLAYINHDIDDAIRAGIISQDVLPKACIKILGQTTSQRINTMVLDVIKNSWEKPHISMSEKIVSATETLKEFMFENVYVGSAAKEEEEKAQEMLKKLFIYFMDNPHKLPELPGSSSLDLKKEEYRARAVCDYIAGMTDRFALTLFKQIFIPRAWAL
ncbi:MAG: deoxyguanosinetriphosphate triphosphohydrolase family protein [Firmicutes bacterium]|nr:deoxyguanosinetriphosphate triphosphohydrolase family protein [Bacillota bacterium]